MLANQRRPKSRQIEFGHFDRNGFGASGRDGGERDHEVFRVARYEQYFQAELPLSCGVRKLTAIHPAPQADAADWKVSL
jgi:hypothetical protein